MDARDELMVPAGAATEADLAAVKRVYEMIARAGVVAGVDELLGFCHDDLELSAYAVRAVAAPGEGRNDLLRGRNEVREFFRRSVEDGFALSVRTRGFEVSGDTVVVRGSIRVGRPDGSFAESSIRWNFRFRDGLVDRVRWEQRAGD